MRASSSLSWCIVQNAQHNRRIVCRGSVLSIVMVTVINQLYNNSKSFSLQHTSYGLILRSCVCCTEWLCFLNQMGNDVDIQLIERFYDISSDFDDSISLIALALIFTKRSDLDFVTLKNKLCDLELTQELIESIEDLAISTLSEDMLRLIRLISPIDNLFVRERPRDIPSVITAGRAKMRTKKKPKPRAVKLCALFEGM